MDEITISSRKLDILTKGVESYIASGEPVTSSGLKEMGVMASSATIRSELNHLDELGYFKQLHTSSGRVPTEKGYMAYVSSIASRLPKNTKQLNIIKQKFMHNTTYLSQLIRDVAKVVSDTLNYPTVVLMDGLSKFVVKNIKIVRLLSNNAFVLIETNMGIIDPIVLTIDGLTEDVCGEASRCLTSNFQGQTIESLINNIGDASKQIEADLKQFQWIFKNVVEMLKQYISEYQQNIVTSGTENLLDVKDLKHSTQVKALVDFIEHDSEIGLVLKEKSDNPVDIKVGNNETVKGAGGFGLVKAKCSINGIDVGSIAVVGPQRMDYLKIAASLKHIASEFDELAKNDLEKNPKWRNSKQNKKGDFNGKAKKEKDWRRIKRT